MTSRSRSSWSCVATASAQPASSPTTGAQEWLDVAATGTANDCARAVHHQFDLGVDGVIMHGATPTELAPVVKAFTSPA